MNASSDFSSLPAGTYNIYGISYKSGGSSPPNDVVLTNFIGQPLTDLLYGGNCVLASENHKKLSIEGNICAITGITLSNISACMDNGTADPSDDTFTADVTVLFANAPNTGTLDLRGDASGSVALSSIAGNSHTFTGLSMKADGGAISLTAAFSDNGACILINSNAGLAPAACSAAPCAASFTALSDLRVDAGIQANLGGGTPSGGTYDGPGVTDKGNGTYDFDPATAGVGTHSLGYTSPTDWTQLGQDIDGLAPFDWFGIDVSLSADGSRIAVGGNLNDDNGQDAGHVRVFEWNGSSWRQLGDDINGEAAGDRFGSAISLSSDGNLLAIGAPFNGGVDRPGHVRVFEWNGSAWVQLGNDIDGDKNILPNFGGVVSLSSDGSRLAISSFVALNPDGSFGPGRVRVYSLNGTTWTQVGLDIVGTTDLDRFGGKLSFSSNGSRLAIAAIPPTPRVANYVRVVEWNGTAWGQIGTDILGEAVGDGFGSSVSLSSDGARLAIGGPSNDGTDEDAGHARVYNWNGTDWDQLGVDIDGEAARDLFGAWVSLSSDGNRLAAGATLNDGNGANSGNVRIFDWSGSVWVQVGNNINGEAAGDVAGRVKISPDGKRVVIGATSNDGNGDQAGHVRVFELVEGCRATDQVVVSPANAFAYSQSSGTVPNTLHAFPNPTQRELEVHLPVKTKGSYSLKIVDINGRTVFEQLYNLEAGLNNLQLNVSTLSKGMYMIFANGVGYREMVRFTKE